MADMKREDRAPVPRFAGRYSATTWKMTRHDDGLILEKCPSKRGPSKYRLRLSDRRHVSGLFEGDTSSGYPEFDDRALVPPGHPAFRYAIVPIDPDGEIVQVRVVRQINR